MMQDDAAKGLRPNITIIDIGKRPFHLCLWLL